VRIHRAQQKRPKVNIPVQLEHARLVVCDIICDLLYGKEKSCYSLRSDDSVVYIAMGSPEGGQFSLRGNVGLMRTV